MAGTATPDTTGSHKWNGCNESVHTGRWPANLIHDGSEEVLAGFPDCKSGGENGVRKECANIAMGGKNYAREKHDGRAPDSGSAARFFYTAKASASDRDDGLQRFARHKSGHIASKQGGGGGWADDAHKNPNLPRANIHPTVKPIDLMQYLCRLVTPPGGAVLDLFMGSGSTGKAALIEGFAFVGIEREPQYFDIAKARITHAACQDGLFAQEAA
jgi:site-specific DNA-methyltransferase (adenine-specific)